MANKVITFKRGTGITHFAKIPIASYYASGVLFFTAKPIIDNDETDAAAVINKGFTSAVVDTATDPTKAIFTLEFLPADIETITFADGESEKDYLGEFKYVVPGLSPITFPGDNKYIETKIYADVKLADS